MGNGADDRFDLRFRLSEERFRQAHRAYLRHSLLSVKNLILVTLALGIGAVQAQIFGGAAWAGWIFAALWAAVIGLVIFTYVFLPSRVYRRVPSRSLEQHVVVDSDGLDWEAGESHR